ncbi:MAG: hypothetical protein EBU30_05375 [Synechococcaceae bacterium WB6_3B_236]|nr:hypothetical protein [Synechococcaceae bacterium WB6_3B_236]
MAPTICGGQGHGDALSLADSLLHLQGVVSVKTTAATWLQHHHGAQHAPEPAPWQQQLNRLQHLEQDLALLPVGWGADRKGPMLKRKRTPIAEGDVLTFKAHRPRGCSHG